MDTELISFLKFCQLTLIFSSFLVKHMVSGIAFGSFKILQMKQSETKNFLCPH